MKMATATMKQHKHELQPGEVCGTCDLRAPPAHRCGRCTRLVPDWPTDEIGCLEAAGWALQKNGRWLEPEERVMRSPTPEMVADATNAVGACEAQFASPTWGA